MPPRQPWFERTFPSGLPAHLLAPTVERLRGTPARLAERLASVAEPALRRRQGDTWSIQENVGHLMDLEPLWRARLAELKDRKTELAAADLQNRRTHEADHNAAALADLLRRFRSVRAAFVAELEALPDDAVGHAGLHPRLKQPMNAVDLAFFVAEHDDYHLARIAQLMRALSEANT